MNTSSTTSYHYYTGTAKWAKLTEAQATFFEGDLKGKFCSLCFYFTNPEEKAAFRKLKTRKQFKVDDETGEEYIDFRRYLDNANYPKYGGPPLVIGPDKEPFTKDIGNGSTVTVKISVYDSKAGKATRLEAVRVDDWVEYVREENPEDENRPF